MFIQPTGLMGKIGTFLSDRAPDGDNEDTDDGENQQCQHTTYHCVGYGTVSLNHCAGVFWVRDEAGCWEVWGVRMGDGGLGGRRDGRDRGSD